MGWLPSLRVYYKDASNNPIPITERTDSNTSRSSNITQVVTDSIVSYQTVSTRVWSDGGLPITPGSKSQHALVHQEALR